MFTRRLSTIAAVLLTTVTLYGQSGDYSLSLKYGLTSIDNDDGWELKNNSIAVDATYDLGYMLMPRVELTYVDIDNPAKWGGVSALVQGALSAQAEHIIDTKYFPLGLYAFGGLGYEYVKDGTDVFDSLPFMQGGIGAKIGISKRLNFLTEVRALQVFDSNNDKQDEDNEYAVFIGLNFPFLHEEPAAPKVEKALPAPVAVVPEPEKVEVLDSDHDGVPDAEDDCPGTVVTEDMEISERGCEVITVKDSDGDMVADADDQCPNTPEGAKVDSTGCAVLMTIDVHFDTNSAKIKPESYEKIKLYARYLKDQPEGTIVTIVGHTDNTGNEKWNKKLSYKRALAVRDAILKEGLDWRMVKARGAGSSQPIADNTTAQGRAQNRRITAEIIHPEGAEQ